MVRKRPLVASPCPSGSRGLGKCAEPARSPRDTGWGYQGSSPRSATLLCHKPGARPCPSPGNGVFSSSSGTVSCSAAPNIPNSASSRSRALSQQHQGSFPSRTCREQGRIPWKAPNALNGRARAGEGPCWVWEPAAAVPPQDPLGIPGGSEPFPVLPHGPDSSHWIWSHGEQPAPEDARATITVIRNGGSGLADPAGILRCFVEVQIAWDVRGPLLCPMLLRRDVHTCAGTHVLC